MFFVLCNEIYPYLIIMSAGQENLVEMPTVSKEAAKKISHLEQEFIRAEVEQRMFFRSMV